MLQVDVMTGAVDRKSGEPLELPRGMRLTGAAVHRLHMLLSKLSTKIVDSPSCFSNAPGYYAVYFTDDENGLKVEYVHVANPRGDS